MQLWTQRYMTVFNDFFHCKKVFNFPIKVRMKTRKIRISFYVFTSFSYVPISAWSIYSAQRFQSLWKWGCIKRVGLMHLRTGLAAPLAMMKRLHVCCCRFFTAHGGNCHFELFIEAELVFRFVFSFFFLYHYPTRLYPSFLLRFVWWKQN